MPATENQKYIEKTIETSDFLNGGLLSPEQQARFITLVKRFATMLPLVRSVRMPQAKMEIDKLYVGEPVTESVDENTSTGTPAKPKFSKVELEARKVKSSWNLSRRPS
jgi:HK97 family phage major capsid protein